ncbi:hypothetical protein COCSUDRAFT_41251 [Coccomyxa subellipsoidea C-169]|uniref:L domain-like protein n=1 Tax=Coccomyxa subellipsoidea (strain C-169) TaxID=574566 RepID=I0YZS4_COCSC|nr:hypothetical protein COCSUDRAFT_41251 [Coccomyxa subellipsoidea C-169]EIE23893.1 hypothetical protein COCSUDRAFT_41251 [Coccomyxa subellipsoidea C-169]|eukprot:XP_005648437.1 hypothetical protein COCSUDRAFT_41251 [Coccomyxa subellipsoidea C-169]
MLHSTTGLLASPNLLLVSSAAAAETPWTPSQVSCDQLTQQQKQQQQEGDDLAERVAASRALCAELDRQRAQHASWEAAHLAERQKMQAEVQRAVLQFAREHVAAGRIARAWRKYKASHPQKQMLLSRRSQLTQRRASTQLPNKGQKVGPLAPLHPRAVKANSDARLAPASQGCAAAMLREVKAACCARDEEATRKLMEAAAADPFSSASFQTAFNWATSLGLDAACAAAMALISPRRTAVSVRLAREALTSPAAQLSGLFEEAEQLELAQELQAAKQKLQQRQHAAVAALQAAAMRTDAAAFASALSTAWLCRLCTHRIPPYVLYYLLSGLESCLSLQVLNLSNNALTSIKGVNRLTLLREVDLSVNSISSLGGLQCCSALEKLNLDDNKLISVEGALPSAALSWLSLANNSLTSIAGISACSMLDYLSVQGNQIASLSGLQTCTRLCHLDAGLNQLTAFPTTSLPLDSLRHLVLNGNRYLEQRSKLLPQLEKEHSHAKRMAGRVRRLLERGEALRQRSAITIQAAWRAHSTRRAAHHAQREHAAARQRSAVEERAALIIQAAVRGWWVAVAGVMEEWNFKDWATAEAFYRAQQHQTRSRRDRQRNHSLKSFLHEIGVLEKLAADCVVHV